MKTIIIKSITNAIPAAVDVLRKGGVIIYPSESSYGMGADATNSKAIRKMFRIKGRKSKPTSIIVSSQRMAKKYACINKKAASLIKRFMPGRLTLVVKKKRIIPYILSKRTIGFRIPPHEFSLALLKRFGRPITATSANKLGKPPIYRINDVIREFSGAVDLIIDAGNLPRRQPSTVFDVINRRVIRKGPVKEKEILKCLKA